MPGLTRSFDALDGTRFDLLVIGGGIYGAWIAYDAGLRGLNVALVEKNDWAGGTSSRSSKLIHGGLRYLEHGHLGLVRKALKERRLLSRLGPHRVRPLRFAIPLYEGSRLGRWRVRAGLLLYDAMAGRDRYVEGHRYLRRGEMLSSHGFLRANGLDGGFTYGDCVTDDARMVLEIVDGAASAGGIAVNHAKVLTLLEDRSRIRGARIQDGETGRIVELRAKVTVNCTGAWSPGLERGTHPGRFRMTRGVHLIMPRIPSEDAVLLFDDVQRRVVFLIPWYGRTMLGTTDTSFSGSPDHVPVTDADVSYLLEHANRALEQPWSASDVIGAFAGVRVLPSEGNGSPTPVTRDCRIHESDGGLLTPVGGKLSSARAEAALVTSMVMERLGRAGAGVTGRRPLPWSPGSNGRVLALRRLGTAAGLDEETASLCADRYGSRMAELVSLVSGRPDLSRRIVPDLPFCRAEIVHAVVHEMARNLDDILRRRIPLTLLSPLSTETLRDAADLAGDRLGWTEGRRLQEVDRLSGLHTGGQAAAS